MNILFHGICGRIGKETVRITEEGFREKYTFTAENALDIILKETGKVFAAVLEDAGVYKNDEAGRAAFRKFAAAVNE